MQKRNDNAELPVVVIGAVGAKRLLYGTGVRGMERLTEAEIVFLVIFRQLGAEEQQDLLRIMKVLQEYNRS